ncbi:MAG: ATP-binding cassette domain-containing protein [Desulfovermiculus sp.]|nr:ATP-binding cassette domain-containing protein [Desulfovermiculus sp.]
MAGATFFGENGAGKSTLLSCLLGLCSARGRYLFSGIPVTTKRRRKLWQKVDMVFQDCTDQLFCPSVAEEVTFGLEHLGLKKKEIRLRVEAAFLQDASQAGINSLSGGYRERSSRAIINLQHEQEEHDHEHPL